MPLLAAGPAQVTAQDVVARWRAQQGQVGPQGAQRLVVAVRVAPQVDEDVLHDVLRGGVVAEHLQRRGVHGRSERVDRLGEGAVVTRREPGGKQVAGGTPRRGRYRCARGRGSQRKPPWRARGAAVRPAR